MPADSVPERTLDAARRRIDDLRGELRRHEHFYYVLDRFEISDVEFDALMGELQRLEARHPELVTSDSPSQRVGGTPRTGVEKARHSSVMLSLDNAFDDAELRDFDRRARELAGVDVLDYVGELKLDGVSMAARFAPRDSAVGGSRLTLALMRGDGVEGEVITPNARTLRSLPLSIPASDLAARGVPGEFEVRGEVVMPAAAFAGLNARQRAADKPLFANPRNAAAGALRTLDAAVTAARRLDFYPYLLLTAGQPVFASHWEALEALAALGFKVNSARDRLRGVDGLRRFRDTWLPRRAELPYGIDGLVFKVDAIDLQRRLGATSKSPRWAIACKPAAQQAETVVDFRFVRCQDPAVAAGIQRLERVQAEASDATQRPYCGPSEPGADRLGAVFDDVDIVSSGQCENGIHITGQATEVNRNDRPGLIRDHIRYILRIDVPVETDVGEHGPGSGQPDRGCGRNEGVRCRDDFIALSDVE